MPADARRYHMSVDLANKNLSITYLILLTGRNKRVLEAGPATGYVTEALRARGCQVTAIEKDPAAAELAARFCERMVIADIEALDIASTFAGDQFDVVMFGDVLEHLVDPKTVLEKVRPLLREGGYVVASIPNIAHASVRVMLLDGKFAYTEKGLLDHTHLRFFTKSRIEALFQEAGYSIRVWRRTSTETLTDPFAEDISPRESELPPHLMEAIREDPEALTYQFVVRAYPRKSQRSNRRGSQRVSATDAIGGALNAFWHLEEVLAQKDRDIAHMDTDLAEKDALLAERESLLAQREEALREMTEELTTIRRSLGYRLLNTYRRVIRWLMPPGSRRALPYRALMRLGRWLTNRHH